MDTKKIRTYLDVATTDKLVGITEYGKMTIPYVHTEDARTLDLTPLALKKDEGPLGDEHWKNPRSAHYLAQRYLNTVMPPKGGVSSNPGKKHSDGTPCKAKSSESCPFEKNADDADDIGAEIRRRYEAGEFGKDRED